MNQVLKDVVVLSCSVNKIWDALTLPTQMKEWYFDVIDFKLEVNHIFYFYEPGEHKKFLHKCKILQIINHQKFSHTWTYPELVKGESVVTWFLEVLGDKTRVTLTHEHLEAFAEGGKDFVRENFEAGWKEILGKSLKEFVKNT